MRSLVTAVSRILDESDKYIDALLSSSVSARKERLKKVQSEKDYFANKSKVLVHGIGQMTDEQRQKHFPNYKYSEVKNDQV